MRSVFFEQTKDLKWKDLLEYIYDLGVTDALSEVGQVFEVKRGMTWFKFMCIKDNLVRLTVRIGKRNMMFYIMSDGEFAFCWADEEEEVVFSQEMALILEKLEDFIMQQDAKKSKTLEKEDFVIATYNGLNIYLIDDIEMFDYYELLEFCGLTEEDIPLSVKVNATETFWGLFVCQEEAREVIRKMLGERLAICMEGSLDEIEEMAKIIYRPKELKLTQ